MARSVEATRAAMRQLTIHPEFLHFLQTRDFWIGGAAGALGLVLGAAVALVRRRHRAVIGGAGLWIGVAFSLGVARHLHEAGWLLPIIAGLVALTRTATALRLPKVATMVVLAPGAWLLATQTGLTPKLWIEVSVTATTAVGGVLASDFDGRWGHRGLGLPFYGLSVIGLYYTVPDNREALVLLGLVLPLVLLGWPVPTWRLGSAGSVAAVAALAWTAARDGLGRQSAIVGGLGCLALLVLEPLVTWLRAGRGSPLALAPAAFSGATILAGVQLGLVTVSSRIAGIGSSEDYHPNGPLARGSVRSALAIVSFEVAVVLLVGVLMPGGANQRPAPNAPARRRRSSGGR
jgi:hypothetical protein